MMRDDKQIDRQMTDIISLYMHIDNTLEIEGKEQKKREGERENRRHSFWSMICCRENKKQTSK